MNKYCCEYSLKEIEQIKKVVKKTSTKTCEANPALSKLLQIKNRISIFNGIDEGDIYSIIKDVKFVKFKKGSTLINRGDTTKTIYFILLGECMAVSDSSKVMGVIKSGHLFGEIASILNKKRGATIVTSKDSTVLSFEIDTTLVDKHPDAFMKLFKNVIAELEIKLLNSNRCK
jgi:CRP-like cAMP-binding protein